MKKNILKEGLIIGLIAGIISFILYFISSMIFNIGISLTDGVFVSLGVFVGNFLIYSSNILKTDAPTLKIKSDIDKLKEIRKQKLNKIFKNYT